MSDLKWRLRKRDELITWHSGSETVVYDAGSGDTHLFDMVAFEGFIGLLESQVTENELVERLASRLEVEPDEQLRRYVGKLIEQLDAVGLLETTDS